MEFCDWCGQYDTGWCYLISLGPGHKGDAICRECVKAVKELKAKRQASSLKVNAT